MLWIVLILKATFPLVTGKTDLPQNLQRQSFECLVKMKYCQSSLISGFSFVGPYFLVHYETSAFFNINNLKYTFKIS